MLPLRAGASARTGVWKKSVSFWLPFWSKPPWVVPLVVGQVKAALDTRLGREVALASDYNLLHRHGWRKLAPDNRHPQSDPLLAQEEWKKTPRNACRNP